MSVIPIYAPLFAFMFVGLSVRTLVLRRRLGIPVGHGDHLLMHKAMRAHANFAEYVPLALLLIALMDAHIAGDFWVHVACLSLALGRLLHAYGISQVDEDMRLRVAGMALTFTALLIAAKQLLLSAVV